MFAELKAGCNSANRESADKSSAGATSGFGVRNRVSRDHVFTERQFELRRSQSGVGRSIVHGFGFRSPPPLPGVSRSIVRRPAPPGSAPAFRTPEVDCPRTPQRDDGGRSVGCAMNSRTRDSVLSHVIWAGPRSRPRRPAPTHDARVLLLTPRASPHRSDDATTSAGP